MMILDKLKSLTLDRSQNDDLIELYTFGAQCLATYDQYKIPKPEWLKDSMSQLDNEIRARRRDMLIQRQKEVARKLGSLRTREEKVSDLEAEQASINDELGIVTPKPQATA